MMVYAYQLFLGWSKDSMIGPRIVLRPAVGKSTRRLKYRIKQDAAHEPTNPWEHTYVNGTDVKTHQNTYW